MYRRANDAVQAARRGRSSSKCLRSPVALLVTLLMITSTMAGTPEDEVRATFDRFVAAQNAHDIKAVESLLLGSADFLWITRGTAVWGQDAATKRFAALYSYCVKHVLCFFGLIEVWCSMDIARVSRRDTPRFHSVVSQSSRVRGAGYGLEAPRGR